MKLAETLRADAARQRFFSGGASEAPSLASFVKALISPRFAPVLLFRLSAWSAAHHLRPVGKLFSMINFVFFGLEIGMDCDIGPGLYFPHTSGTVLGALRIGSNAVIYHNVTVGAKFPDLAFDPSVRPVLGNDCFLGSGAKILGNIVLGDGVTVGANAVVLHSVPSGSTVVGIPGKIIANDTKHDQ